MGQEWAQNGLKTHKNAHPNERIQGKMKRWKDEEVTANNLE